MNLAQEQLMKRRQQQAAQQADQRAQHQEQAEKAQTLERQRKQAAHAARESHHKQVAHTQNQLHQQQVAQRSPDQRAHEDRAKQAMVERRQEQHFKHSQQVAAQQAAIAVREREQFGKTPG